MAKKISKVLKLRRNVDSLEIKNAIINLLISNEEEIKSETLADNVHTIISFKSYTRIINFTIDNGFLCISITNDENYNGVPLCATIMTPILRKKYDEKVNDEKFPQTIISVIDNLYCI